MEFFYLFLCLVPIFGVPLPKPGKDKCGYEACHALNSSELNIHLVAHSHNDVGWLKTVDQYYYGSTRIQFAGVQYIIDSVIQALRANPRRKFIQVETAFFYQWWQKQSDKKKEQLKQLVRNGQFEIVGAGWSMNDEAAAHYHSIIDQLTFGIKYMEDTLGQCARPKIGWQIDPFGHTREMASIFAQMGYDALFFARLDYRDKAKRLSTSTAEMLWRGSANLGNDSLLFTHALYDHYSPPPGFYFDTLSQDDALVADARSPEYNLKKKVADFTKYVSKQASQYTSNNIMITMGNDFTYQNAHYSYKNLDTLIKAYEDTEQFDSKNRRIRLHYSTPNCYVKAVNDYANQEGLGYKVKTDDFIPYANDKNSYWSGYYTSRPTQKRLERQGNNLLQAVKQLVSTGDDSKVHNKRVDELRAAMAVMQHHDAVTGTEKQAVANDYGRIMSAAFDSSTDTASEALQNLLAKQANSTNLSFKSCLLANISYCEESRVEKFVVIVYNPLSQTVSHHVRLPVDTDSFTVTDFNGADMKWQITPSIDKFDNVPIIRKSKFDLVFFAENLPPLGAKSYYVTNKRFGATVNEVPSVPEDESFVLGDEVTGVRLNPETGFLVSLTLHGIRLNVGQQLMYYHGAIGSNGPSNRTSGAYVFRPDPKQPNAKPFSTELLTSLMAYKGEVLDEVHQTFTDTAKQIIRVYKNVKDHVEIDWLVGPIDVKDGIGKEIISRFELGTFNPIKGTFFTDSNGRELLRRVNNYRETFVYTNEESAAGNYYPITSSLTTIDEERRMEVTVLTDRSQGGASLEDGKMEFMLHRRLLKDDGFGVGEALNETEFNDGVRVRGQHFITLGSTKNNDNIPRASKIRRGIAQKKILAPWVFIADASSEENTFNKLKEKLKPEFSLLKRALSDQIQILTLERWADNQILLRLEHVLEIAEGGESQKVDLNDLFASFKITEWEEMNLAANSKLEEISRMRWTPSGCLSDVDNCEPNELPPRDDEGGRVTLRPMEIRTFIVSIQ